jgi:crotonobetainyl-CoA:carnitine CoA-transferase CaiB-like acyl-CoA transferase
MMNTKSKPLEGVHVLELSNRLSISACGFLLSELGAHVSFINDQDQFSKHIPIPLTVEQRIRSHSKTIVHLPESHLEEFFKQYRVILTSIDDDQAISSLIQQYLPHQLNNQVICSITDQGVEWPYLSDKASDSLRQALSGLMAVSGLPSGKPEFAKTPISEMCGSVMATLSILACVFANKKEFIDLSLLEVMADQLRTHISLVPKGTQNFRLGCGHPLCSPWDVYQAKDGWVIICASSDAHWHSLVKLMNVEDLLHDERFINVSLRRANKVIVDEIVTSWTSKSSVQEVVEMLRSIGMPCGPATNSRDVPKDIDLQVAGTVQVENNLSFARTPIQISAWDKGRPINNPLNDRYLPLDGIRVIEFTAYAAGPMTGYLLAALGAEVIKIEPPNGEEGRKFKPQFGGVSGYFINYNAGKKSIEINLQDPENKKKIDQLIDTADVVLHNMRPGAMDKLGFGIDDLMKINPSLVYCSISGYGLLGPKLPALDTVIQGHLGLTDLFGNGQEPIRVGYSIADQLSGHFASAAIVAALIDRKKQGQGQIVDIAMSDAIAWITQLNWQNSKINSTEFQLPATDGWVISSVFCDNYPKDLSRYDLIQFLKARNIEAAPVLEIDEVIQQDSLVQRGFLYQIQTQNNDMADLISPPLGIEVYEPKILFPLGTHNYLLNTST